MMHGKGLDLTVELIELHVQFGHVLSLQLAKPFTTLKTLQNQTFTTPPP